MTVSELITKLKFIEENYGGDFEVQIQNGTDYSYLYSSREILRVDSKSVEAGIKDSIVVIH